MNTSQSGGFLESQIVDTGTPGDAKRDAQKRMQNVFHMNIQQILTHPGESIKIGRIEVNLVELIARIKSVELSSTKIKYELEDDTGTMTAQQWLEAESEESSLAAPQLENTYCRLVGSVRSQEGSRYLMLLHSEPVQDANMITEHLLQVIHDELAAHKPAAVPQGGMDANTSGAGMPVAAPVKNEPGQSGALGGTNKDRVYQYIMDNNHLESGVNKRDIAAFFGHQMSAKQIDEALEFLCNEGQVYTTVDDDHFKSTES